MTPIVSLVTLPCRFHQQSVTPVRPTGYGVWSVRDARDASTASFYINGGSTRYTGNVVNGIRVSEVASATSGKAAMRLAGTVLLVSQCEGFLSRLSNLFPAYLPLAGILPHPPDPTFRRGRVR